MDNDLKLLLDTLIKNQNTLMAEVSALKQLLLQVDEKLEPIGIDVSWIKRIYTTPKEKKLTKGQISKAEAAAAEELRRQQLRHAILTRGKKA